MAGLKTPAAKSPATPSKHRKALILEVLVGWLVGPWGVGCPPLGLFRPALGSYLAPCGRHLGAGWVDEGLDVTGLVGCHLLGRRLAEKGPQKAWRAKTIFTHISNGF